MLRVHPFGLKAFDPALEHEVSTSNSFISRRNSSVTSVDSDSRQALTQGVGLPSGAQGGRLAGGTGAIRDKPARSRNAQPRLE